MAGLVLYCILIFYLNYFNKESAMKGPSKDKIYPLPDFPEIIFLKNIANNSNVIVGDYTYCNDPKGPSGYFDRHVFHHYSFIGDKLIIGKFCSIARDVKFLMNGGNHDLHSLSTYPFQMFEDGWDSLREVFNGAPLKIPVHLPLKGDTRVGNDVWLGLSATILPGVTIGDGSIVGAQSVVTRNVPPYTIVAGNPAKLIRKRFSDDVISKMEKISWWDWPIENINDVLKNIISGDADLLWQYAINNDLLRMG